MLFSSLIGSISPLEEDQEGVVWGSSQHNEAEEQQLEVANKWSHAVMSDYQSDRMRNSVACFLKV